MLRQISITLYIQLLNRIINTLPMKASTISQYGNETIYAIQNDAIRYTWAGYFLFVLVSSLIGDTTILLASTKYRAFNLHRAIIAVIQHIAFCDLLVAVTDVLTRIASVVSGEWVFGTFLCLVTTYSKYYFNTTSMLLICNMTTTKLLLLKYPLRLGTMSLRNAHKICVACWLVASTMAIVPLLVDCRDVYFSYRTYHCDYGFSLDAWQWLRPCIAFSLVFVPNCLVITTTIWILAIAKRVANRGRQSLKWQGIMTTVLVATVYCVSFMPAAVYRIGEDKVAVDDESNNSFHISFYRIAVSFMYINTTSNFYIHSLSVHSFRDFLRSRVRLIASTESSAITGKMITSISHNIYLPHKYIQII